MKRLMISISLVAATASAQPSREASDRVKLLAGTWKCTGTGGGGTFVSRSDLDGAWVHDSFVGAAGQGKVARQYKVESYATYDSKLGKWRVISIDSSGAQMVGTSEPMKDGKQDTLFDKIEALGKSQMRDHIEASDPNKLHLWAESSIDGKTWTKGHDLTCTK